MTDDLTRHRERFAEDPNATTSYELLEEEAFLNERWQALAELYRQRAGASSLDDDPAGRARVLLAHDNTSTAVIEMSCEDIREGDELVPWENIPVPMMSEMPEYDRLDVTAGGGPTGQIVSARDGLGSVAAGHVIFTDLGQHSGVTPGDDLPFHEADG